MVFGSTGSTNGKMFPGIKKCGLPGVFVSKMLKELSHKHLPMNQCRLPLLDVFISIIRYYKNSVNQEPGWNSEKISWCKREAERQKLKDHDYWGGFVIDEMKIQVCASTATFLCYLDHVSICTFFKIMSNPILLSNF
jgi:hypothetical protein